MKRLAVILLFLIYGVTTIGATIHMHFCMSKYVGWSIQDSEKNACENCGMTETKDGCCSDKHQHIKLKIDQNWEQEKNIVFPVYVPVLQQVHTQTVFAFEPAEPIFYHKIEAPPPRQSLPLYLSHCVFLI